MINADIISLRLSHDMDPVGINTRFFSKLIRSAWEPSRHAGKPCPDIEVAAGYHRFDIGFVSPQGTFLSFNNHPSYQGLYDVVVKSGMYEKTIVTVTEQQRATLYRRGYPPHDNRVVDALLFAIEDLGIYLVNSPDIDVGSTTQIRCMDSQLNPGTVRHLNGSLVTHVINRLPDTTPITEAIALVI